MEPIKILFSISTLSGGGAERVVSVWASELAECGFSVTIMLSGHTQNEYPLSDKVEVKVVSLTYGEYQNISAYQKYIKRRNIIKQVKPKYIISFLTQNRIWTYLCSWGIRCKRIETIRNSPWHTDIPSGITGKITSCSFRKCYKLLLQSSDQGAYFSEDIQKKSVVIPNPISEIYETHYKMEFADKVHICIAVGRITEQKNYFMMIDAFSLAISQLPESEKPILKIFGSDDSKNYIEKLRAYIKGKKLESSVMLMGRTSHVEIEYANADLFLMSSNYEGMPNALAEAMASRLTCISTDCKTGPRDLITDGENGFLVPVGDVRAMSDAILRGINMSKQDRIILGDRARNKIMTYCSKENSVAKLSKLLV